MMVEVSFCVRRVKFAEAARSATIQLKMGSRAAERVPVGSGKPSARRKARTNRGDDIQEGLIT